MNSTKMTDSELLDIRINIWIPNSIAELNLTEERVTALCLKATNGQTVTVEDLNLDQSFVMLGLLDKIRSSRKSAAKSRVLKKENKCGRCGGAGRSDRWIDTGSVCYECRGSGKRTA